MTIDREVAEEVKRLLAEGRLSQRKIAGQVGIARDTVKRIAKGKWQDHETHQSRGAGMRRISPVTADEITRLLNGGGMTHRQIAAATSVSPSLVGRIKRGERGAGGKKPRKKPTMEIIPHSGPAVWCEECRATVKMPCLACQLRAIQKRARGQRD